MRLFGGLSVWFVAISGIVTFASHMFRLDVAWARFCFNFGESREISIRTAGRPLWQRPEPESALPVLA
jgi:DNA end-binding protein Ku